MAQKTAPQPQAPKTENLNDGYKAAPTPGGNFVKLAIGADVKGTMVTASMEMEEIRGKKNKGQKKERYTFSLKLEEDTVLLVGKKKQEKERQFQAGDVVTLPDHGYLTSVMRRTACELANVPFDDEADTDLKPLVGVDFIITRLPDGEIASGQFAGTASALYDVKYKAPVAA